MSSIIERPRRIVSCFAAAALIEFIIYYILSLYAESSDAVYYYLVFAERLIMLAIPVVCAAVMIRLNKGLRGVLIDTALVSLTRAIFFIPFFYLDYVYGPYDSIEGITLSLITTLITVIVHALITLLIWWLMTLLIKCFGKCHRTEKYDNGYPLPYLRFNNKIALSIGIISFVVFAINLVIEIVTTVIFFMENGSVYYIDEILLILFSYVYLIILFLALHLGSCFFANKCMKSVETESEK